MKKLTFSVLLFVVLSNTLSHAQTVSDAVRLTDDENFGSARIMALGGAFTALGGDPGSVAINPAGSAVSNYSSIAVTPGFNISKTNPGGNKFKFDVPNTSAILSWDSHHPTVKRFTLGANLSTTSLYNYSYNYSGRSSETSLSNYLASWANGLTVAQLKDVDVLDKGIVPWSVLVAWKSAMIDPDLGEDDPNYNNNKEYWGMSQNLWSRMAGPVNENYKKITDGSKRDIHFSAAMDIADKLYLGLTLGVSAITYICDETNEEIPVDRQIFTVSKYGSVRCNNYNKVNGSGIFGQFGLIYVPTKYLRFGVSYRTPTHYTLNETFQYYGETYRLYDGDSKDTRDSYTTPMASDKYVFVAPGLWNFGVAGVIANRLVLSLDYTLKNYGNGRFQSVNGSTQYYDGTIDEPGVNKNIKQELGFNHTIKFGAEVKMGQHFAGRLGYNYTVDPQRMDFCAGLGYDSKGMFYADVAFRYARCQREYIRPYGDYLGFDNDEDARSKKYENLVVLQAPVMIFDRSMFTVALTLGFRF